MSATIPNDVIACPTCGAKNRVPAGARGSPYCGNCHASLPWITEATDSTFREVVEESSLPVLVDLWAPWCGPCHVVSPALEQLARDFAGRMKLVKVNVDSSPSISQRFAVQGIPTMLVVRDGDVVARRTGAAPESALRGWLEETLPKPEPSRTSRTEGT